MPASATPAVAVATATPAVAVAFSGGHDSTALLHATCAAAQPNGLNVVALHVHHGLLPEADAWLRHVQALCARWRRRGAPLRLLSIRLTGRPAPGDSIEAWARRERYAALTAMAHDSGATLVLLAQHRRDQAETVLLQALRGAGPAGLAAMPASAESDGLRWARPWLAQPREVIDAYLRRHGLRGVDDPSNADPRFARSRLRAEVWPVLQSAFGDAEVALANLARRAAEAQAGLSELAAIDLAICADATGLRVTPWLTMSAARRVNALRHWCRSAWDGAAPETLIARLLDELPGRSTARFPAPGGELRLYRGLLAYRATPQPAIAAPPQELRLDLSRHGCVAVPAWGGAFEVTAGVGAGISPTLLQSASLRPRCGGEQFQSAAASPARSLKKQFQARAVPAQERAGPLVWCGDRLLFVPGLGHDARALAPPGQARCQLHWRIDPGT